MTAGIGEKFALVVDSQNVSFKHLSFYSVSGAMLLVMWRLVRYCLFFSIHRLVIKYTVREVCLIPSAVGSTGAASAQGNSTK